MEYFSPLAYGVIIDVLVALSNTRQTKTNSKQSLEQSLLSAGPRVSSEQILPIFTKNTLSKAEKKGKKGQSTSKRADDTVNRQRHKQKHPQKPPARWNIAVVLLAVFCLVLTHLPQYHLSLALWNGPAPVTQTSSAKPQDASPAVPSLHTVSYLMPLSGRRRRYHRRPRPGWGSLYRVSRPKQRQPCGCSE